MNIDDSIYKAWLEEIKRKIKFSQLKAAITVNSQIIGAVLGTSQRNHQ